MGQHAVGWGLSPRLFSPELMQTILERVLLCSAGRENKVEGGVKHAQSRPRVARGP